jgi:hypothetical protein
VVGVFCLDRFLDIPVERAATEAAARVNVVSLNLGNGASFPETVGEDSVPSTSYLCWLARCDDDSTVSASSSKAAIATAAVGRGFFGAREAPCVMHWVPCWS